MACRNCNSALGLLSRRPASSLRAAYPSLTGSQPPTRRNLQTTPPRRSSKPSPTKPAADPVRDKFQDLRRQLVAEAAPRGVAAAYAVYGNTERLTRLLCQQADYTISAAERRAGTVRQTEEGEEIGTGSAIWHTDFGLLPTFSSWAHVSMLHLYLVVARLRACDEPQVYKSWQTQLVDHFFHEVERRIVETHGITSGMMRQRYLKDLFVQWRGLLLAYDEGLVRGDAVLASAVWRNLYKGREDVDVRALAGVVGFMRRCLVEWDRMNDQEFLELLHSMGSREGKGEEGMFVKMARYELSSVDVPAVGMKGLQ